MTNGVQTANYKAAKSTPNKVDRNQKRGCFASLFAMIGWFLSIVLSSVLFIVKIATATFVVLATFYAFGIFILYLMFGPPFAQEPVTPHIGLPEAIRQMQNAYKQSQRW